ncbi:Undecaprenyl-phosphate mannosyltransferase [Rubripirellula lacrimiformis]|uniref:Undecaprenyl-phosphate mannosyltransferase n=1 Tax=Rubripirellula lacrimiformis TaxID=1930273 RepID=A0A517N9L3_9BACT|nr:polyprenol monophosphomannose synthase [Rubripirellula lacrimiformis]QDT03826.1 Undecaprenyl-phosphate mannosyltransferase [Rubripirellula lacrimiformis]
MAPPPLAPKPRVLIGVCTLNEADNIVTMLPLLRRSVPDADILVIDDRSTDGTIQLVEAAAKQDPKIHLDVRDERGLGGAIRHAMQAAVDRGYDFFINLDGDLSHNPQQLPQLLERSLALPAVDVVIGSRYVDQGKIVGWPMHRRIMSRMVNRFATLCLRLPVQDCSGSMRCYRVSAIEKISLGTMRSNGYSVLEEILVRLHRNGSPMAEVPITFTDRLRGQSKLTPKEAARSIWQMLKLAAGS